MCFFKYFSDKVIFARKFSNDLPLLFWQGYICFIYSGKFLNRTMTMDLFSVPPPQFFLISLHFSRRLTTFCWILFFQLTLTSGILMIIYFSFDNVHLYEQLIKEQLKEQKHKIMIKNGSSISRKTLRRKKYKRNLSSNFLKMYFCKSFHLVLPKLFVFLFLSFKKFLVSQFR